MAKSEQRKSRCMGIWSDHLGPGLERPLVQSHLTLMRAPALAQNLPNHTTKLPFPEATIPPLLHNPLVLGLVCVVFLSSAIRRLAAAVSPYHRLYPQLPTSPTGRPLSQRAKFQELCSQPLETAATSLARISIEKTLFPRHHSSTLHAAVYTIQSPK